MIRKVYPRGPEDSEVVIIGDAPSIEDIEASQALAGHTGAILNDILHKAGFNPNKALFVNCFSYRKLGEQDYSPDELDADASEILIPLLKKHPRKVVLVLGRNAAIATGAMQVNDGINKMRGKILSSEKFDYPIVASIHPYLVAQKPDEVTEFYADLRYAHRVFKGNFEAQAPITIHDIENTSDIELMMKETTSGSGDLSYDFEATDKDPLTATVVTCSFANGAKEGDKWRSYFWGGYDQLAPRYEDHKLKEFIQAFDELVFMRAGKDYGLVSFNASYDDVLAETWVGHELPGSSYDVMLMKWAVNSKRPHDLKSCTATYLGYPNYEAEVDEHLKLIKDRRKRILTEAGDFRVLKEYAKREPDISKSGRPKWPDKVEKGLGMYAMLPYDILRLYNAYDAVYTHMLFCYFFNVIEKDGLQDSAELRHRISRELIKCEKRGFLVDVATNRAWDKKLDDLVEECEEQIKQEVKKIDPELDFNPNSNPQLAKILYGEPVKLPTIERASLYTDYHTWKIDKQIEKFEKDFYGNMKQIRSAVKEGGFDFDHCANSLADAYEEVHGVRPKTRSRQFYCQGLYEPIAFSKKTGEPSCGAAVLQTLIERQTSDLLTLILMQRKAKKIASTFIKPIYNNRDKDNVIRPRMNVVGTETGRISSSGPNAQNFIKYIRGQLIPRPGYQFVEFDLSQAEVRVLAALSGDEVLMAALEEEDIHRYVASLIFKKEKDDINAEERRYAKTILFGIIYGMSEFRLALAINVSVEEAKDFIDRFKGVFVKAWAYLASQIKLAKTPPHFVYTPFGSRNSVLNILSCDRKVSHHTANVAMNSPIQGAAGELTLYYICEIMDTIRSNQWDIHLVNTVHDSVTLETPMELAWEVDTGDKDKNGKSIWIAKGPIVEEINKLIAKPVPISPLDTVPFKADVEINMFWSGKPDLKKALDPNPEKPIFRWDLLQPETATELEELEDLVLA
jgi:uracil-DNA glycosylase family 4